MATSSRKEPRGRNARTDRKMGGGAAAVDSPIAGQDRVAEVAGPVPSVGNGSGDQVPKAAGKVEGAAQVVRDLAVEGHPPRGTSSTTSTPAKSPAPLEPLKLTVELVQGCLTLEKVPIMLLGRYACLPPSGILEYFDKMLDSWISRAIELRMIGSDLGELFYIPLKDKQLNAEVLLLVGMGEPGRFSRDQLRMITMNAVVAIKGLGIDRFGTLLMGASRGGLPVDRALRALLEGMVDGMNRLPASVPRELHVMLSELDPVRFSLARRVLEDCTSPGVMPAIALTLETRGRSCQGVALGVEVKPPPDLPPDAGHVIRFTISASPATGPSSSASGIVFQYSALSDSAVIPVREHEVKAYFTEPLPERIIHSRDREDQHAYGRLLSTYLLPEDFLRLLDSDTSLTLILDSTSAVFPWEMAVIRDHRDMSFLGPEYRLTRQFRSTLSTAIGVSPPLNDSLNVLIIADPAPPPYQLDGAREEGLAVVRAFALAKQAWGGALNLNLAVRIGSGPGPDLDRVRTEIAKIPNWETFIKLDACDHLEILKLLLNDHFDILHYAGHGIFDPIGQRRGWVFDERCILSATEIFLVPQVPRLVFANACHSSQLNAGAAAALPDRIQQVSLAEAFFARGLENYIGAGWEVDDKEAQVFAIRFYLRVLGIELKPTGEVELGGAAPPDTLGVALAEARRMLLDAGSANTTWGAYQHYGHVNAKLLAFTNTDADRANLDRRASAPAGAPA